MGAVGVPAATATVPPLPTVTPLPSHTATASPIPTATAFSTPTATETITATPTATATATHSPTATSTPTVFAIVRSRRRVNVRTGPGIGFSAISSLAPGSGVQILSADGDVNWYRVRLDNGAEGWVSASLLRLTVTSPSDTSFPHPTEQASATTQPATVRLPDTPIAAEASADELAAGSGSDGKIVFHGPIVDIESIKLTATVLVANAAATTTGASDPVARDTAPSTAIAPTAAVRIDLPTRVSGAPRSGVDVFAFCNNPIHGIPAPVNLTAGSTIEIFWAWFASTNAFLRQHFSNATHELRVNGTQIANVDQFRRPSTTRGSDHVAYWYVPYGPLQAGDYRITYRVTWRNAISDGYKSYGPGSRTEFEEESCNFVVR